METQPLPGRRRLLLGLAAPVALALAVPASDAAQTRFRIGRSYGGSLGTLRLGGRLLQPRPSVAPQPLVRPTPHEAPARTAARAAPRPSVAALPSERALTLHHLHTGESLRAVYYADGRYLGDSVHAFEWLLRDWRAGRARSIDPELLDLLFTLHQRLDCQAPVQIVCGYRTPETNAMLRRRSEGVARNSLHIQGMAIDLRVPGRSLSQVRRAATSLKAGGVGYYPASDFVHVDTGRVRYW